MSYYHVYLHWRDQCNDTVEVKVESSLMRTSRQIAANRIPLPPITPELLTGELGKKKRAECLPTRVKKANMPE